MIVPTGPEGDAFVDTAKRLFADGSPGVLLGAPGHIARSVATLERSGAEILLGGERTGIVVPESALVDDGGVMVVYLQIDGESFARAEVEVVSRQSGMALVEGLEPGARLVVRGGNAIRRATLVSQGGGADHIH